MLTLKVSRKAPDTADFDGSAGSFAAQLRALTLGYFSHITVMGLPTVVGALHPTRGLKAAARDH
jgi:hypothetical protein